MKNLFLVLVALASVNALASDPRDEAVLASPMVKAIQIGLKAEQGLNCVASKDEDTGDMSVNYFIENNVSKFELFLNCDPAKDYSAIIKGVIGDSNQTAVESFRMGTGGN
jgi:hypothetical protein